MPPPQSARKLTLSWKSDMIHHRHLCSLSCLLFLSLKENTVINIVNRHQSSTNRNSAFLKLKSIRMQHFLLIGCKGKTNNGSGIVQQNSKCWRQNTDGNDWIVERRHANSSQMLRRWKRAQTASCIDHVVLNNVFTKHFNDTGGIWNANRDFDVWTVLCVGWSDTPKRGGCMERWWRR